MLRYRTSQAIETFIQDVNNPVKDRLKAIQVQKKMVSLEIMR